VIRIVLAFALIGLAWSTVWFQEDGVTFFVPGVGGYHWEYR
jgi:hypothetical protein